MIKARMDDELYVGMLNIMQAVHVVEDHCPKYNFKGPYLLLKDLTELIVQNKKELKII